MCRKKRQTCRLKPTVADTPLIWHMAKVVAIDALSWFAYSVNIYGSPSEENPRITVNIHYLVSNKSMDRIAKERLKRESSCNGDD